MPLFDGAGLDQDPRGSHGLPRVAPDIVESLPADQRTLLGRCDGSKVLVGRGFLSLLLVFALTLRVWWFGSTVVAAADVVFGGSPDAR